jgi:hypothetical protein
MGAPFVSSTSMNVRDNNCRWKEKMIMYISLSFNRLLSRDAAPGTPDSDPPLTFASTFD